MYSKKNKWSNIFGTTLLSFLLLPKELVYHLCFSWYMQQKWWGQGGVLPGQHMNWHQLESALVTRSVLLGTSGRIFRGGPCYLRQWNGTSLLWNHISHFPDIVVYSDASGSWGCGALTGRTWLQHQWIPGAAEAFSIAHKEFVPIIMAAAIWGG